MRSRVDVVEHMRLSRVVLPIWALSAADVVLLTLLVALLRISLIVRLPPPLTTIVLLISVLSTISATLVLVASHGARRSAESVGEMYMRTFYRTSANL